MNSKYLLFSVIGLAAASLTGCYEMDTLPLDQYLTDQQKVEAKENNPEMAQASITGITGLFSTYNTNFSDETHSDFGIAADMLNSDCRGIDMVNPIIGYNWFLQAGRMSDCSPTSNATVMIWGNSYKQIFAANAALTALPEGSEDPTLQFYQAQAYAMRAYDYFILAQTYQFTYKGNEQKPCVMLITEKNQNDAALNGAPRATVQAVYDQIISDLNKAVDLLTSSGVKPEQVLSSKPKRFVSLATAYGLRARVNLVMNNWEAAADDAQAAIDNFSGRPLSLAGASVPGFNTLDASNWMWGIAIAPTDRVVTSGIVNFPSHMGSLNYGYATVGAYRALSKKVYEAIPETDVRKGWFTNAEGISANLNAEQQAYVSDWAVDAEKNVIPYIQVKFAPYQDIVGNSENASDIMLMRVEEMYYILAEATAMNGGDGASILTAFVSGYRDPSYSFAGSGEAVQEECWNQRRVEFFGEGLATFDLMRLKKPFDRRGAGWAKDYVYNIAPDDPVLLYPIPETEVNGNKLFTTGENNPSASMPKPVADI